MAAGRRKSGRQALGFAVALGRGVPHWKDLLRQSQLINLNVAQ